jgi:hypothetical protein
VPERKGNMVAAEKQISPHAEMMSLLHRHTGPIPDGAAQGAAAKWLAEKYSPAQVEHELLRQLREVKEGKRRGAVSLLTVKREIGTQVAAKGPKRVNQEIGYSDEEIFSRDDAAGLVAELEASGKDFGWQIGKLREQYRL